MSSESSKAPASTPKKAEKPKTTKRKGGDEKRRRFTRKAPKGKEG